MRLIDLEPHWVSIHRWDSLDGTQHYYDIPPRIGGISFYCPVHTKKCNCCGQYLPNSHRLVVWFTPFDGGIPEYSAKYVWNRIGQSFDDLTLTPSVDASETSYVISGENIACWHGLITNGNIQ